MDATVSDRFNPMERQRAPTCDLGILQMTIEARRDREGKRFCNHATRILLDEDGFNKGKAFTLQRVPLLVLGQRICGVGFDCGFENKRLLNLLKAPVLPHMVTWKCDPPPIAYVSGKYVMIEAPWPDGLQWNDIHLDDVSSPSTRSGSRIIIGPNARGINITLPARETVHVLIAGQTNSGKTYMLRSFAAQLAQPTTGYLDNMIVLLDGKGGEGLGIMNGLPGQVGPLAVERTETVNALGWCLDEMAQRYERIRQSGGYPLGNDTPDLWILFDEFQIYTQDGKDSAITEMMLRLTTQGRAAKIHVCAGTQKPLVSAFGNSTTHDQFSAVVGGKVRTAESSRALIGSSRVRCDLLLDRGDMYVVANSPLIEERVQAAYIPVDKLATLGGGQPPEWPLYDAAQLGGHPTGRPSKCTTTQEIALGLETVIRDRGRPWFRKQFESDTPGAGRARQIIAQCKDIVALLQERGVTYATT